MKTYNHIRERLKKDGDYFNAKIHRRYLPSMYVRNITSGSDKHDLDLSACMERRYKGCFPGMFRNGTCKKALVNVLRMYKLIDNTKSSERYRVVRNIYTEDVLGAFCNYFGIESMHSIPVSAGLNKHTFLSEYGMIVHRAAQQEYVDRFIKKWVRENTRDVLYRADGTTMDGRTGKGFPWCRSGEFGQFETMILAYRRYGAYVTAKYFSCLGKSAGVEVVDLMPQFESADMDVFDQAREELDDRIRIAFKERTPRDIVGLYDRGLKFKSDEENYAKTGYFS